VIAGRWGYHTVFFLSGVGRIIGILVFIRFVRLPQVGKPTNLPAGELAS
jgi:dipeptide/tripeptide permease